MVRASPSVPLDVGDRVGKRGRARAAAYELALGEAKGLVVALDGVEIDRFAPVGEVVEALELADRVSAMHTKLIRGAEAVGSREPGPWAVGRGRDRGA
jgi:hypothetical protein